MTISTNGSEVCSEVPVPSDLSRLRYFFGQLLTQRDLQAEQAYHLRVQRLVQRESFGMGTTAGLRVVGEKDGTPLDRSVIIEPGLAFDSDGRELVLQSEVCLLIADPPDTRTPATYLTSDASATIASEVEAEWDQPFSENDLLELRTRLEAAGLTEVATDPTVVPDDFPATRAQITKIGNNPNGAGVTFELEPGVRLVDYFYDQLIGTTFLGLRYRELGKDPAPAVLDASCCGDVSCFPTRTEQGVVVVCSREPFPKPVNPHEEAVLSLETCFGLEENSGTPPPDPPEHDCVKCLCEYVLGSWRGLPSLDDACEPLDLPVVPIACVTWSRFAREPNGTTPPRILQIDNCECRPLAPGAVVVRALVEALTQCRGTVPIAPRFDDISPADGAELVFSGTEATVTARSTVPLATPPDATWQIDFYPLGETTNAPFTWTDAAQPGVGFDFTIAIALRDEVFVDLVFTSTGGSLVLPAGTYVWWLNLTDDIQAQDSSGVLDGDPGFPYVVPTGDGKPGGKFRATFYVPAAS